MYGVLYALSLELLPIKARGTGYTMVFTVNCTCNAMVRVSAMFQKCTVIYQMQASIIALYANINTSLPMWVSGAVLVLAGFIALFLPIEPRGDASLESQGTVH